MKINTGIAATDKRMNILGSVIGQMSDGIWENTRSMEKYWKSLHYEKGQDGNIWIEDKNGVCADVLGFFATKIKQIIKTEIDDGNSTLSWDRSCGAQPHYMHGNVTVGDCYELYELLKGRNTSKNSYSSYHDYNVELKYDEYTTIHMQVSALNEQQAKRKAVELLMSKIKATAELA